MPINAEFLLDRAGCWFIHSGIQEANGGVARYYRADNDQNARISTEITGYTISTLVYLYERRGDAAYLQAARAAADFLTGRAWDPALRTFPFEHSDFASVPHYQAFFFDSGIIIRGLLALWRVTSEERLLQIAQEAGRGMAADFPCPDGFHPILDLPSKRPLSYEAHWSKGPGCYQLKSAMAWRDLYDATGAAEFEAWYQRAAECALTSHAAFLPAPGAVEHTVDRLHAYCYFLEGLLPLCADASISAVVRAGIERVSGYAREIAPVFERSDVYAQLLRVRLYAEQLGGIPVNEPDAREEAQKLAAFQHADGDKRVKGGWNFGRRGGELSAYINPVSTAFCLQTAAMWHDRRQGCQLPPAGALI